MTGTIQLLIIKKNVNYAEKRNRRTMTMTSSWRHKITILLLALYWPTLFILAHIPIPKYVQRAGISDKCLHFLAYILLTFLFWFALRPNEKVRWRRGSTWWVIFIIIGYSVIDEVLQSYVGRTCDAMDIATDLAGVLTGLFLFSFLTAALSVAGIIIFGVTNLLRANLAELLPVTNTIFHIFAYAVFSALWLQNIRLRLQRKGPDTTWLIQALSVPTGLLIATKLFSVILGKYFTAQDIVASMSAIIAVIVVAYLGTFRHT
jgi:VanZ family protein